MRTGAKKQVLTCGICKKQYVAILHRDSKGKWSHPPLCGHDGMSRVIRDTRDGSMDYWLPTEKARSLFEAGYLAQDLTNHCYTEANIQLG